MALYAATPHLIQSHPYKPYKMFELYTIMHRIHYLKIEDVDEPMPSIDDDAIASLLSDTT